MDDDAQNQVSILLSKLTALSDRLDRVADELVVNRLPLDTLSTDTLLRLHSRLCDEWRHALKFIQDVAFETHTAPRRSRDPVGAYESAAPARPRPETNRVPTDVREPAARCSAERREPPRRDRAVGRGKVEED